MEQWEPHTQGEMAQASALWDFDAQGADEVSLRKDDGVAVLQKFPDDWWQVRKLSTGEIGVVPSNYLFVELRGQREAKYLPPGWESTVDAETSERYYYNKATGHVRHDLTNAMVADQAKSGVGVPRSNGSNLSEFKRLREEADAKLAALRCVAFFGLLECALLIFCFYFDF